MLNRMSQEELIAKWSSPEGLNVNHITDYEKKWKTAQLLENVSNDYNGMESRLFEAASTTTPTSQATGQFQPISLALAQRVMPDLFAWKVVGVQPMNGPVGLAYALRYYYKGTTTEAGFQSMPSYSGFTGSTSGTTGTADAGTGVSMDVAEAWALGTNMPQLVVALEKTAIEAKTRKLAANYSLEAEQDIRAMHNVELSTKIVERLHYQVRSEKDRELLARMKAAAINTNSAYGGEAATTFNVSASDGRWQQEKFTTIVNIINKKARDLMTANLHAPANFVIVSNRVGTALQSVGNQFMGNTANANVNQALTEIGTLNGTMKIYVDAYASTDYALVGYKGQDDENTGIIYSPYVMGLKAMATTQDDFSPRLGIIDRFAITDSLLGSGRYYRQINFSNIDTIMGA